MCMCSGDKSADQLGCTAALEVEHYENMPMQYTAIFTAVKMIICI